MTDPSDDVVRSDEEGREIARKVEICVPDDAVEGDTIEFVVDGQELELSISADMKPGSIVQLTLAGRETCSSLNRSHGHDDEIFTEERVVHVPLYDDIVLNLRECNVFSNQVGDGTSAVSWSAGEIMAKYLAQMVDGGVLSVEGKSVCELGAGLGGCGLAAAIGGASSVIMTDYGPQHLQGNIDLNLNLVKSLNPGVELLASKLIWGEELQSGAITGVDKQFDVILGSDILYDSNEGYEALVQTCNALCAPSGEIYIGVRWRKPHLERSFFLCMEKHGFLFARVNIPTLPCTFNWDVYGTDDVKSCAYLRQPISAKGEKVPLCEVTEEHQRIMTDKEYQEFEALQTQVFCGKRRKKPNQ